MGRRPVREVRAQPPAGDAAARTASGAVEGVGAPGTVDASGRVLTIPNLISFARLLGVPLFLYLFLVAHQEVAGIVVLAVGGTTDWVDGYIARRLRQVSRLGELLDPFADRLYILATLLAFTVRDVVPWQFTAALLARELVVMVVLAVLRQPLPVHYVGKTATFILLFAFPVLLLAASVSSTADVAGAIGWALAWWGLALYWAAAALYAVQAITLIRGGREATVPDSSGAA